MALLLGFKGIIYTYSSFLLVLFIASYITEPNKKNVINSNILTSLFNLTLFI